GIEHRRHPGRQVRGGQCHVFGKAVQRSDGDGGRGAVPRIQRQRAGGGGGEVEVGGQQIGLGAGGRAGGRGGGCGGGGGGRCPLCPPARGPGRALPGTGRRW